MRIYVEIVPDTVKNTINDLTNAGHGQYQKYHSVGQYFRGLMRSTTWRRRRHRCSILTLGLFLTSGSKTEIWLAGSLQILDSVRSPWISAVGPPLTFLWRAWRECGRHGIFMHPTVSYYILLHLTASWCIPLHPTSHYCILLHPTVSYWILLYPTVSYCIQNLS